MIPTLDQMAAQTSRMLAKDGTMSTLDMIVNDYVTIPLTTSATNAAISLIQAGVTGKSLYISYATWRVSGGSVGSTTDVTVDILDGTTLLYRTIISKSSSNGASSLISFSNPIKLTQGNSFAATATASGVVGTTITLNYGLFVK